MNSIAAYLTLEEGNLVLFIKNYTELSSSSKHIRGSNHRKPEPVRAGN